MTFPPSSHPNSFSFPSFDLNIFFLQCKQSSSLVLSVESAISKRLEDLKFVTFLGAAPLDPSLGCAVSPSCFTRPLRGLANSTSCYPCSHMYLAPPPSFAPLATALDTRGSGVFTLIVIMESTDLLKSRFGRNSLIFTYHREYSLFGCI